MFSFLIKSSLDGSQCSAWEGLVTKIKLWLCLTREIVFYEKTHKEQ